MSEAIGLIETRGYVGLVEASDAWGEPVGTGGAALRSGAWAAARIAWQCSQHLQPKPTAVQQTLF